MTIYGRLNTGPPTASMLFMNVFDPRRSRSFSTVARPLSCAALALLMGLPLTAWSHPRGGKAHRGAHSHTPSAEVEMTGRVIGSGVSRGKTIAAWNGIPTGHVFLQIQPEGAVKGAPDGAQAPYLVQLPTLIASPPAEGARVHLVGHWRPAKPMPRLAPDGVVPQMPIEPAQIPQMPIEPAPVVAEPIEQAPIEQAPVEQAPVEQAPGEQAPGEPEAQAAGAEQPPPTAWQPVAKVPVFVAAQVKVAE